jgi:hypothetical protein
MLWLQAELNQIFFIQNRLPFTFQIIHSILFLLKLPWHLKQYHCRFKLIFLNIKMYLKVKSFEVNYTMQTALTIHVSYQKEVDICNVFTK